MKGIKGIIGIGLLLLAGNTCLQAQSKDRVATGIYIVVPKSTAVFKDRISGKNIYIANNPEIDVRNIEKVSSDLDVNGMPALNIKMDAAGKEKLTAFTARMKGRQTAIIVDNRLLMAPYIANPISGGQLSIRGGFSQEDINTLKHSLQREIDSVKQLPASSRTGKSIN
jgi:preprotein translocase subunit SecD